MTTNTKEYNGMIDKLIRETGTVDRAILLLNTVLGLIEDEYDDIIWDVDSNMSDMIMELRSATNVMIECDAIRAIEAVDSVAKESRYSIGLVCADGSIIMEYFDSSFEYQNRCRDFPHYPARLGDHAVFVEMEDY